MSALKEVESLTKHFGIYEKFTSIICRDNVLHGKPDPEIYLKSAKQLQLLSENCVVIEDTKIGAQSALRAQMKCYILLNGLNSQNEFADTKIEGFIRTAKDLEKIG